MSVGWKEAGAGLGAAALGAVVAVGVMTGMGHGGGAPDARATGAIVRSYILDHPELIPEAMNRLQDKQTAQAISANRDQIEAPFAGAVAGNPKGDVTLVEYFDYACGYCRQSVADVDKLIANDPKLRVVYKELPVLDGAISDRAAQVSLVAAKAGKFVAFHHALYQVPAPLDDGKTDAVAAKLGLDTAGLDSADIVNEINANLTTGRALRMSGTPTFVVGDQLLAGAVGYDALKAAIDKARAARG
ncbi:DsbA family protein [Sphingomonas sp. CGMCC 1.13654]|uniref:DsbA family protein n=1 Tax=Sphingomonas chungangi TaxID=2683589 RepID=A0A838L3R5_9SPHN|nr:DsbA family protein [Sphingomonas chungangi]MBA2933325.1 DsbA family protein [Sphingomonas chungangi]